MKPFPCLKRDGGFWVEIYPELPQQGIQSRASKFLPMFSPRLSLYVFPILAPKKEASGEQVWGALRNSIKGKPNNSSGEAFAESSSKGKAHGQGGRWLPACDPPAWQGQGNAVLGAEGCFFKSVLPVCTVLK